MIEPKYELSICKPIRHFFRIDKDLGAKTAAHIGCDDPQLVFRCDLHKRTQHQALQMRILAGRIQRVVASACIEHAHAGAWFHGVRD